MPSKPPMPSARRSNSINGDSYVIGAVAEKLGPTYGERLQIEWIETAYAGGDMYDEIADDIEMCLRQLKHLIRAVGTKWLELQEDTNDALAS